MKVYFVVNRQKYILLSTDNGILIIFQVSRVVIIRVIRLFFSITQHYKYISIHVSNLHNIIVLYRPEDKRISNERRNISGRDTRIFCKDKNTSYNISLFFLIGHTHVVFDLVPTKTHTGYRQMTTKSYV